MLISNGQTSEMQEQLPVPILQKNSKSHSIQNDSYVGGVKVRYEDQNSIRKSMPASLL